MTHEKAEMELLCRLDRFCRDRWRHFRLADQGEYKALQRGPKKAAAFSARHRISHCLDHSLCPDGDWRGQGVSGPRIQCPVTQPAAFFHTAGFQLLLEHYFLQLSELRPGLFLAAGAMGLDPVDDSFFPQGGCSRRLAANPIPALGGICGLFEFRRVDAEPIRSPASIRPGQGQPAVFIAPKPSRPLFRKDGHAALFVFVERADGACFLPQA